MLNSLPSHSDVIIIGAGPSATAMASSLSNYGIDVLMVEREQFPRFTIGESLLPEAINCLEMAGLLGVVDSGKFQYKDGAFFVTNEKQYIVDFANKFSLGKDYAYQVHRAEFDLLLADFCVSQGAQICYNTSVTDILPIEKGYCLTLDSAGQYRKITTDFLIDASGFGRVLAKKFKLDSPSGIANKSALFSHIDTDIRTAPFDRNKILIAQAEVDSPIWYWVIPFSDGHCSVGVVVDGEVSGSQRGREDDFQRYVSQQNMVSKLIDGRSFLREVGCASAYSSSISSLHGERYVILGNAGEFIDPIFSSGVTIALKSAVLAAPLVAEQIKKGTQPDWESRFELPLREGIETFKQYILAWYSGILPNLLYCEYKNERSVQMINSILAGYVWDRSNPFTRATQSTLKELLLLSK